jgi:hypothetical protein
MPVEMPWHGCAFPLSEHQPIAQGRRLAVVADGADPMGGPHATRSFVQGLRMRCLRAVRTTWVSDVVDRLSFRIPWQFGIVDRCRKNRRSE